MDYSVPRSTAASDIIWWESRWYKLPDSQEQSQAVVDYFSQVEAPQDGEWIFRERTKFILYLEDRHIKIIASNEPTARPNSVWPLSRTRRLLLARGNSHIPLGPPVYFHPNLDIVRINRDPLDTTDLGLLQQLAGPSLGEIRLLEVWDHHSYNFWNPRSLWFSDGEGQDMLKRTVMSYFPKVRILLLAPLLNHREDDASVSYTAFDFGGLVRSYLFEWTAAASINGEHFRMPAIGILGENVRSSENHPKLTLPGQRGFWDGPFGPLGWLKQSFLSCCCGGS